MTEKKASRSEVAGEDKAGGEMWVGRAWVCTKTVDCEEKERLMVLHQRNLDLGVKCQNTGFKGQVEF